FANLENRHLLREARKIIAKLRMRMRVGGSCKWNLSLYCEFDDPVGGVKFVDRLPPSSCRKLNRKITRTNEIERFVDNSVDLHIGSMTVDFDKVEMGEAIDQPSRGYFTDPAKVISVNCVDIAALELLGASRDAVEHPIGAIEEMDRTQNKVEFSPMSLNPFPAGSRVNWIVIELNSGADFEIGISFPQTINFIKIDSGVITIVIGEGDVA